MVEFIPLCIGACFATGIGALGPQLKTLETMQPFKRPLDQAPVCFSKANEIEAY